MGIETRPSAAPEEAREEPREVRESQKNIQEYLKSADRAPRASQERPRARQDVPRAAQRHPRALGESRRDGQEHVQSGLRDFEWSAEGSPRAKERFFEMYAPVCTGARFSRVRSFRGGTRRSLGGGCSEENAHCAVNFEAQMVQDCDLRGSDGWNGLPSTGGMGVWRTGTPKDCLRIAINSPSRGHGEG